MLMNYKYNTSTVKHDIAKQFVQGCKISLKFQTFIWEEKKKISCETTIDQSGFLRRKE